jgi:hypothetical protein
MFAPVSMFQLVGDAWLSSRPRAPGPRNCGQLAALADNPAHKPAASSARHKSLRRGEIGLRYLDRKAWAG